MTDFETCGRCQITDGYVKFDGDFAFHSTPAECFYAQARTIAELCARLAAVEAERDHAKAILAALREPSENVTRAAVRGYSGDMVDAIRDAVEAAEQEVDRD